jgi:NAD-dependent SIR2 family protein deacetylase
MRCLPAHHFLRLLHEKGVLHTVFSQNIDGLEQIAGLPAEKVVNAHGSFDGAHCIDCKQACSIYAVQAAVYDDEVPTCSSCGGLVKPDITFFGEALPARFHRRRLTDLAQADLLIVMGTSLLVQPFAGMIDAVPGSTPRVLINLTRAGERKQQQQQQQQPTVQVEDKQLPCGPFCRFKRRKAASSSSGGSDGEDGFQSSSSSSDSDEECDDVSPALTASSSVEDLPSCCCSPADADSATATEDTAAAATGTVCAEAAGEPDGAGDASSSSSSNADAGGFDFEGCVRDVLCLGDCDSAVQQLAALLGWQQELQQLVEAGDAAFREAQACWED